MEQYFVNLENSVQESFQIPFKKLNDYLEEHRQNEFTSLEIGHSDFQMLLHLAVESESQDIDGFSSAHFTWPEHQAHHEFHQFRRQVEWVFA